MSCCSQRLSDLFDWIFLDCHVNLKVCLIILQRSGPMEETSALMFSFLPSQDPDLSAYRSPSLIFVAR